MKGGDPNHPDLTVLTYKLPFALPPTGTGGVAGDVVIEDLVGTSTVVGDLIRFLGKDRMVFYSDADKNDFPEDFIVDDADSSGIDLNDRTAFPLQANHVSMLETPGFRNGALYISQRGQPGYDGVDATGPTYMFISDTPEPSTLTILGIGVMGLPGCARRRFRADGPPQGV